MAFNDVDLCLKLLESGYRNLWTPYATLYHHESASRGTDLTGPQAVRFKRELTHMRRRWAYRRVIIIGVIGIVGLLLGQFTRAANDHVVSASSGVAPTHRPKG